MQILEAERERYSDEGKPPMEWAQYLEVAPALSGIEPEARDEALAAREISDESWARAESYWTLTLALDLHRARTDRADAYGRACAQALQARGHTEHAREDTLPEAGAVPASTATGGPPAAAPAVPPPPPPIPAPVSTPQVAVPSFLRAAATPRTLAPVSGAMPKPGRVSVAVAALRPVPATGPGPDATSDATPAYRADPLPFGRTASAAYAERLATAPAAPAPADANRSDATVIGTSAGFEPALPFGAAGVSAKPVAKLPELTLEQHAALSAELAVGSDPARRAAVLARYGIESTEALIALGAAWQARLGAEPETAQRWKVIYAEQRTRIQHERRRVR